MLRKRNNKDDGSILIWTMKTTVKERKGNRVLVMTDGDDNA